MVKSSAGKLENRVDSKYSLVIAVAKRAKQIREGAPTLVESDSPNPIVIAMEEIAAGKVKIRMPTPEELQAAALEGMEVAPVERVQAPPVSELLKIEPEEDEEVEIEELEEDEESSEASEGSEEE